MFPLPFVNGYPVSAADRQRWKYCVLNSSAFLGRIARMC
nr:MAG TPA: Fibritin, capping motif, CHAPERONE.0A [Caudoviricetes sp.]DAS78469.1 MAG TPA: Fibritin, capping motif, CHAPERONE.0A [Caudoviricetes sp.]